MSSSTAPPDPPGRDGGRTLTLLRVGLALAYAPLAYWAGARGDGATAGWPLFDLVLLVLLGPLAAGRGWAWLLTLASALALWRAAPTPWPQALLLAPPVLFTAWVAWWFGRSLRAPRVPLITRIVSGLERTPADTLAPELRRYTRGLTAAWAALLAVVALANAVLALLAVPGGVLVRLGHAPAWGVPQAQAALWANVVNYGVVAGFFIVEYWLRKRRFPVRPYRNFVDFVRQMAALGPGFWRDLLR